MKTPFIKINRSYIDIRSIERMQELTTSRGNLYTKIWFKHSGGTHTCSGEEYNIDEIAKTIEKFYSQTPELTELTEKTDRFDILDL